MPTTTAGDGAEIHYEVRGSGAQGIVFIHGWGGAGSGHSWRRILPHVNLTGRRAILVDLRGHGRSGETGGEFTVAQLAADVLAVADAGGLARFAVAGFSMGGKIAQWLACHVPERIAAQCLIAPLPLGRLELEEQTLRVWLEMARRQDRFCGIIEALERPLISREVALGFFRDCHGTPESVLSQTFWMAGEDAGAGLLHRTAAPTLVIGGTRDGLVRPAVLQKRVVAAIPGARLHALDSGHHITLSRGPEVAALLDAFLREHPPS